MQSQIKSCIRTYASFSRFVYFPRICLNMNVYPLRGKHVAIFTIPILNFYIVKGYHHTQCYPGILQKLSKREPKENSYLMNRQIRSIQIRAFQIRIESTNTYENTYFVYKNFELIPTARVSIRSAYSF